MFNMRHKTKYVIEECPVCKTDNRIELVFNDIRTGSKFYRGVCTVCGNEIELHAYEINYN